MPPRDPKSLAEAIMRLLDDPVLRAQMGSAGQARAEDFSWPRVTAKVEEYYGFVIRRLAAGGTLPSGFHAEIPQAPPPLRARVSASASSSDTSSASAPARRHDQVE